MSNIKTTRTQVTLIANRLHTQGKPRSKAFFEAWAMVKTGELLTKVAGVTFGKRQKALNHLSNYKPEDINIQLIRDFGNTQDNKAVAVLVTVAGKGSYNIGYLPRKLAHIVAILIDKGISIVAEFKSVVGKYFNYMNYGCLISVKMAK